MKVHYRTASNRMTFEVQGDTPKAIFRTISEIQDVFECDDRCGRCQSPNIRFRTRTVDDNDYFELKCQDCHAALAFGQTRKGDTLFPKRKDQDGNLIEDRGWVIWRKPQ